MKKKIISMVLIMCMFVSGVCADVSLIFANDNEARYNYTMLALSEERGIVINANGGNIGGQLASNGNIATGNVNVNSRLYSNMSLTMPLLKEAIYATYFSHDTNIETQINMTQCSNLNTPIRATGNIVISGSCINGNGAIVVSETGNVEISASNISLSGLIYAPYGKVVITGDNVNLNGICIISDSIEINANNTNITSNQTIMNWVNDNAVYDVSDIVIYVLATYSEGCITVKWHTNREDSNVLIYESDDNISYNAIATVKDTKSYDYHINREFDIKYIKVSVCGIESVPIVIKKCDAGYTTELLDTDGDEVPDVLEEEFLTDINNADTDSDGLTDYEEIALTHSDPCKGDSIEAGKKDGDCDSDGDGIDNKTELEKSTDPINADTDSDNLSDKDEIITYGTNPLVSDTDSDGLEDGSEIRLMTNPLIPDTDNDGVLDGDEIYEQVIANDNYDQELFQNNNTRPTIIINGKGDVNKNVRCMEYEGYLKGDGREFVGKCVEVKDSGSETGTIKFTVNDDYKITEYNYDGLNTNGLIICVNKDNQTIPLGTRYNSETKELVAEYVGDGIYYVINAVYMLENLGINVEDAISVVKESVRDDKTNEVATMSLLSSTNASSDVSIAGNKVSGQVDIVFVVDKTGSMGDVINNVKNNITGFVDILYSANIRPYFALVEYGDITCDGKYSTRARINEFDNTCWFSTADSFKNELSQLYVYGGGDAPETAIDGLEFARRLNLRDSSQKFFVLVTDAGYKINNNYGIQSMDEMIALLTEDDINTSVITSSEYKNTYSTLYNTTGGIYADIYSNFRTELISIANKIVENTNNGEWVALNGLTPIVVKLDGKPTDGGNYDSDQDGLTDVEELGGSTPNTQINAMDYILAMFNKAKDAVKVPQILIDIFAVISNPALKDTDKDGLLDGMAIKDSEGRAMLPKDNQPTVANGYAEVWNEYYNQHIDKNIQTRYDYSNWGLDVSFEKAFADFIVNLLLDNRDNLKDAGMKIRTYILLFKSMIEGDTVLGAYILNFIYDTDKVAYHSQPDTWQREFGYNDFYDDAFEIGSYMDKGRYEFEYNGKKHAIWMWKGDYWNLQSGAEIGIYSYDRKVNGNNQFNAIDYEVTMKLSLFNYYKETTGNIECLFNWEPWVKQWWVTAFNPAYKDANPDRMVAIGQINLSDNTDLYEAIKDGIGITDNYEGINRSNFILDDDTKTVWVCFDRRD